jgi:hypothetical protein
MMAKKLKIAIEDLRAHLDFKRKINKARLENITWTKNGEVIEVPKKAIEEFDYVGFNNIDFPRFFWRDFDMGKYKITGVVMTFNKVTNKLKGK